MSILIKGMEMPKRCWDCLLNTYGYCMASEHSDIIPSDAPIPEWCPLISVPPHGDLIDRYALEEEAQKRLLMCNKNDSQFQKPYEVMRAIALAPTIIPEDESNMDSFIRIFEEDNEEDGMDSFIRILKDWWTEEGE